MLDRYEEAVAVDRWLMTEGSVAAAASVSRFATDHGMQAGLLAMVAPAVDDALATAVDRARPGGGDVTIEMATDGDYLSVRVIATDPARVLESVASAVTIGPGTKHVAFHRGRDTRMIVTIEAPMADRR
jgi:hypothetical protein